VHAALSKGGVEVVAPMIAENEGEVSHGDASSRLAGSDGEIRTMASSQWRSAHARHGSTTASLHYWSSPRRT